MKLKILHEKHQKLKKVKIENYKNSKIYFFG